MPRAMKQQLKRPAAEAAPEQAPPKQAKPLQPSLAPARGRLIEHLDHSMPEVQQLMLKGFCIVKGVLTPKQVLEARDHMWTDSESLGTGIDRNDPSTWNRADAWPSTAHGLIQNAGWGLFRGVCATRAMTEATWQALFKGEQPVASFDCSAICTPQFQKNIQKSWRDKAVREVPAWLHTDQAQYKTELLRHMQGMVALYPAGQAEMSTVLIAPRKGESAQSLRDRFLARFPRDPNDKKDVDAERREWLTHDAEQKQWLVDNGRVLKPRVEAGDMLIWASGVPHASAPDELPEGQTERGLRMSLMVSCVPRSLVSEAELDFRKTLLEKGRTSGHRVCEPQTRGKDKFSQCIFGLHRRCWDGEDKPVFNMDRRLSDFATRRPNDPAHTATARFCGGYDDAPLQLSAASRWAE